MFRKIENEKAFDAILNQIIENIQDGNIKGGDALPAERAMAESMGVSRPAVREVLRALELLGIVHCVQGGGNYITEDLTSWLIGPLSIMFKLNNGYLRQNQQLRAALERETALLAAQNCTALDEAELRMILAKLEIADTEKERGILDQQLHQKIAKMANNPMLYSVLSAADQLTETIISGIRGYIMEKKQSSSDIDEQHRQLVDAIVSKDAKLAEQRMSEHMETIEAYMDEMEQIVQLQM